MVTKEECDALVLADRVLRRHGGDGIAAAGLSVVDGKVYDHGVEVVHKAKKAEVK